MALVAELTGTGRVLIAGEEVGRADYRLLVKRPYGLGAVAGITDTRGSIKAGRGIIDRLEHDRGHATLALADGREVGFFVTDCNYGNGQAAIAITGAMPRLR